MPQFDADGNPIQDTTSQGQGDQQIEVQYDENGLEIDPAADADIESLFDDLTAAQTAAQTAAATAAAANRPASPDQNAIIQDIQSAVNNMTLPDTLFPADLDFSDPTAVRTAMTNHAKHTMQNTIPVILRTVNAALQELRNQSREEMQLAIQSSLGQNTEEQQLNRDFPLINDPKLGAMYKTMDQELKANNVPVAKRIVQLKALATRLNHKVARPDASMSSQRNPNGEGSAIIGAEALDLLFGAPRRS